MAGNGERRRGMMGPCGRRAGSHASRHRGWHSPSPQKLLACVTDRAEEVSGSHALNACAVAGLARDFRSARIRMAGLAMLRPRSLDMTELGRPGQPGGPVDGPGPARAKTCRPDFGNHEPGNLDPGDHDAGNRACAASACTAFGAGGGAPPPACGCSSDAAGAAARAPKPATMPGTILGFSHHCSPQAGAPARNPARLPPNASMARDSSGHSACPAQCRGGGTSRRSRCRTSRGSPRPRPAPSPEAGPAGPATMTAAGRSEAGERRSKVPEGSRSAGRANGRTTPASVRARLARPDLHRGHRLRPERRSGRT